MGLMRKKSEKNMKILCFLVISLGLAAIYYRAQAESLNRKSLFYQHNQNMLLTKIRRIYEEKEKLEQTNAELERLAQQEQESFNWYQDISNTLVIKQLQNR